MCALACASQCAVFCDFVCPYDGMNLREVEMRACAESLCWPAIGQTGVMGVAPRYNGGSRLGGSCWPKCGEQEAPSGPDDEPPCDSEALEVPSPDGLIDEENEESCDGDGGGGLLAAGGPGSDGPAALGLTGCPAAGDRWARSACTPRQSRAEWCNTNRMSFDATRNARCLLLRLRHFTFQANTHPS